MHEKVYSFQQLATNEALQFELAGLSFCDGSYHIYRPQSELACLEFILEGRGTVEVNQQRFHPVAGDSYFLQPGTDQRYYSSADEPWTKIWLNVSGPLLMDLIRAYGLLGRYYYPAFDSRTELEAILTEAKQRGESAILESSLHLHRLLFRMAGTTASEAAIHPLALELQRYMDLRVEGRIQLADLAAYVGRSESQVIRLFRESFGMTPYAYFLQVKIGLAKRLLRGSQLSVRAIASQLSFADEFYFSNVFKRHVGVSPNHYRKQ